MNKLTHNELLERGYVDVTAGLPLEEMIREVALQINLKNPKEIIIRYDPSCERATFYLTIEDFKRKTRKSK